MVDLNNATSVEIEDWAPGTIITRTSGVGGSGVFTTANTAAAKTTEIAVNWPYPGKELILVIETPYTAEQKPFAVVLQEPDRRDKSVRYIQVVDGEDIDKTDAGCHPELPSDSNYQVILKVLGPSEQTYALLFSYKVVAK